MISSVMGADGPVRTYDDRAQRLRLYVVVLFAFANTLLWMRTIPFDRAPDESQHFKVVDFESRHGRIPRVGVDDGGVAVMSPRGHRAPYLTYSAQPGLSYLISAAFVSTRIGKSPHFLARLPGALYAALFTAAVFFGIRLIIRDSTAPIFAAMVSALWPQVTFLFSYVNNDGLSVVACVLTIAAWHYGIREGWSRRAVVGLGAAVGLVLLSKPSGFTVALLSPLPLVMDHPRLRVLLRRLLLSGATVAAVAGWWYVIAWRRYGPDVFATQLFAEMVERTGLHLNSGRSLGMSPLEMVFLPLSERIPVSWLNLLARSSFGMFEWMDLALPAFVYTAVLGLIALAAAGWLRRHKGASALGAAPRSLHLLTFAVLPATHFALTVYWSYTIDYQPQGRYLFPLALPFVAFFAGGITRLTENEQWRRAAQGGVVLTLLAIEVFTIAPTFLFRYEPSFGGWFLRNAPIVVVWACCAAAMVSMSFRGSLRAAAGETLS